MSRWAESRYRIAGRVNFSTGFIPERLSEVRRREERELRAMASVNLVILMGNLGSNLEIKYTESGKAFCSLSLATTDSWTDKDGVSQQRTEWHKLKVWGKLAENCGKYLKKGSSIYAEGRISTNKWKDKDGKDHFSTEIICEEVKFLTMPTEKTAKIPTYLNDEIGGPRFEHRSL